VDLVVVPGQEAKLLSGVVDQRLVGRLDQVVQSQVGVGQCSILLQLVDRLQYLGRQQRTQLQTVQHDRVVMAAPGEEVGLPAIDHVAVAEQFILNLDAGFLDKVWNQLAHGFLQWGNLIQHPDGGPGVGFGGFSIAPVLGMQMRGVTEGSCGGDQPGKHGFALGFVHSHLVHASLGRVLGVDTFLLCNGRVALSIRTPLSWSNSSTGSTGIPICTLLATSVWNLAGIFALTWTPLTSTVTSVYLPNGSTV